MAFLLRRAIVPVLCLAVGVAACGPSATTVPATPTTPGTTTTPGTATPATATPATANPTTVPTTFDPNGVSLGLETVATTEGGPLAFAALPDGRLYIASQDGRAWVLDGGTVDGEPLVDLRDRIQSGGERGLLGIAVHPDFPDDNRVFVHYSDIDGDTVVSSLEANAAGTRLDSGTEQVVLQVDQPYGNHNGGGVLFGPDGYLYVSLGDGGSGGDPHGYGQALNTLLGKILRIDVDAAGTERAYSIPSDNPFAGGGGEPEIWHSGLRNPWRLSFDRETGDLWIGDVGQAAWEEVDVARAGAGGLNFGWNVMEGRSCYGADKCTTDGLTLPISEYGRAAGATVIGGYVYRGAEFPVLRGGFLFADYGTGRIWAINAASDAFQEPVQVGQGDPGLAAFGEDASGELYLANLDGRISRITAQPR